MSGAVGNSIYTVIASRWLHLLVSVASVVSVCGSAQKDIR